MAAGGAQTGGNEELFFWSLVCRSYILVVSALVRKVGSVKKQLNTCRRRRAPGRAPSDPGRAWREEKQSLVLRRAPLPAEDALVLVQYELHDLVLVDHVHRHVEGLGFGPQQRGAEHDGHALGGHAVFLPVVDHPRGTLNIVFLMKTKGGFGEL